MNDALVMGVLHGTGQDLDQAGGDGRRLGRAFQGLVQAAALEVLHRQVGQALVLADLEHLHDVGVLQAGRRPAPRPEAAPLLGVGVDARQDHLEGDNAIQGDVPRLVTAPMPPLASRHWTS